MTTSAVFGDAWIAKLLTQLASSTCGDRFLAHHEGHFNVAVSNVLLDMGSTLQLGTTNVDSAEYVSIASGWTHGARTHKLSGGSGDVTITAPGTLCLELKCRPDHGPKAQASFGEIADDLARVATTSDAAFLFCFDEGLYCSFDGTARKTKPSLIGDALRRFFPAAASLTPNHVCHLKGSWDGSDMQIAALKAPTVGATRVLVFGRRLEKV